MSRTNHPSANELLDVFSESLSVSAALFAQEKGIPTNEVVGIVADLKTEAGENTVRQAVTLSLGDSEVIRLEATDPNDFAPSQTEHLVGLLVKKEALRDSATIISKALREDGEGEPSGALIIAASEDGLRFRQPREGF